MWRLLAPGGYHLRERGLSTLDVSRSQFGRHLSRYAGGYLLLLLGVAALALSHNFLHAPTIGNDSVQYLDAASRFAAGDGLSTTVAHFDEQVAVGQMPIPFTHFAPGYSVLIGAMMRLGVSPETAGYLISALSYLATILLFWYIGSALGTRPWVLGLIGLLWVANATAILIANFVSTEALFTAIFLAVAALMVADSKAAGSRPWLQVSMGVLAGAAYWIRYPGLFVVPVVAAYLIWRWWHNRRALPWVLVGLAAAAIECLAIMVRNSLLTGSWRGGFSSSHKNGLRFVLVESAKAVYHIVFGDRVVAHLNLWLVLFAGALAAALVLAFRAWRSGGRLESPADFRSVMLWLALLICFYWAGIVYAVMHSIASDLARYYLPAYPLALALLAAATLARKPIENVAIAILVAAVLAVQSRSLLAKPPSPPDIEVRNDLKEDVQPGLPIGVWLKNRTSPQDVLIAANGQMVHYVLRRPVVALIDPLYSTRQSDDAGLHALMSQYRARYLLLFPGSQAVPEQEDTPFLNSLAAGRVPFWLALAARTKDAAVYECASCVKTQ